MHTNLNNIGSQCVGQKPQRAQLVFLFQAAQSRNQGVSLPVWREAQRRICFQAHSDVGRRPFSAAVALTSVSFWKPLHSLAHGPLPPSESQQVSLSHLESLWPPPGHPHSDPLLSFLSFKVSWDYTGPKPVIRDNLPILRLTDKLP